ncbi:MAG: molybdopterin molybdotransferase MoeA [Nannocystaceae bacterium]
MQVTDEALDLDEALARVLADARPLAPVRVAVRSAHGAVAAVDHRARWRLPLGDVSIMDGYAVRAVDITGPEGHVPKVRLRRRGESAAGHPATGPLAPGEAARISTGAILPSGADAVIAQEDVGVDGDLLEIDVAALARFGPGRHVRAAGSEVAEDELLVAAGARLGPSELALLAGAGHAEVTIHRRPTVAILCTGDELRPIGAAPRLGEVISTNPLLLAPTLEALGCPVLELGPVVDDRAATIAALADAAARADVVITSGGVSVGDHDHVGVALRELGARVSVARLHLRPGRPMIYARLGASRIFALPGNPASTYVTFELFARPLLCRLAGLPAAFRRPRRRVTLTAPAPGAGRRAHVVRVRVVDDEATPLPQQASGSLRSLAGHNALVCVPPGVEGIAAGERVEAILLDGP